MRHTSSSSLRFGRRQIRQRLHLNNQGHSQKWFGFSAARTVAFSGLNKPYDWRRKFHSLPAMIVRINLLLSELVLQGYGLRLRKGYQLFPEPYTGPKNSRFYRFRGDVQGPCQFLASPPLSLLKDKGAPQRRGQDSKSLCR